MSVSNLLAHGYLGQSVRIVSGSGVLFLMYNTEPSVLVHTQVPYEDRNKFPV